MPVRKVGIAVALCAAGGALFATAAGITAAKTGGETWLMPVFVFPAVLLLGARPPTLLVEPADSSTRFPTEFAAAAG